MTMRRIAAVLFCSAALWASLLAQPAKPYRILVTNDDGVRAPGILAVATALRSVGEVTIVGPAENQSGKGHSISISGPISVEEITLPGDLKAWSAGATPASCVKVAIGALMKEKPDLVVSGINRGYNLAAVTYVSGTIGAAREAALNGIPAIGASLAVEAHPNYEVAAEVVRRVAERVKSKGLPKGVFLNVNVPAGTLETLKGIKVARQSVQTGVERFEEQKTASGGRAFSSVWHEPTGDVEGTDVWAVEHGYAAVVPLKIGEFDQKTFDRWKAPAWR